MYTCSYCSCMFVHAHGLDASYIYEFLMILLSMYNLLWSYFPYTCLGALYFNQMSICSYYYHLYIRLYPFVTSDICGLIWLSSYHISTLSIACQIYSVKHLCPIEFCNDIDDLNSSELFNWCSFSIDIKKLSINFLIHQRKEHVYFFIQICISLLLS